MSASSGQSGLSTLMGVLRLQPGQTPPLSLRRPVLLGGWLRQWLGGADAAGVPARVGTLFALCGSAQADTAQRALAVAAAAPDDLSALSALQGPQPTAMARRLRLATVREHLQRFWMDGGGAPEASPGAASHGAASPGAVYPGLPHDMLAASPLPRLMAASASADADAAQALLDHTRDWIDTVWLGQSGALAATLAAFDAHGPAGLPGLDRAWREQIAARPQAPGSIWLQALLGTENAQRAQALAHPAAVMLRADRETTLRHLALRLRTQDDFAQMPDIDGQPHECGPWLRLGDSAVTQRPLDAWTRLVMRWVDLARLLAPDGAHWLRSGALRTGEHEGLAWTEMARGVLLHWAQLEPQAPDAAPDTPRRVRDFRVLAPTEWHLHPDGALAASLAGLEASEARRRIAVFDPCVPLENPDA
ncbi:hypothetical protein [Amphibiibacter pelophylacis]|uniref:Uncharacterized protein n=1 Tax=Amphibiibacter pelophylacis TaxID=1799477 RepID=A0ACC6NZY7_9BURK